MEFNNKNKIYQNFYQQMNASMMYIKQLCSNYLRHRGNETFENMAETWKLLSLETKTPDRISPKIENELDEKIYTFFQDLNAFDQMIDFVMEDTTKHRVRIEHGEEISISIILKFLQAVKGEIKFTMMEAENLFKNLNINKPDLESNKVEFNSKLGRTARDFLVIKDLITKFEETIKALETSSTAKSANGKAN